MHYYLDSANQSALHFPLKTQRTGLAMSLLTSNT